MERARAVPAPVPRVPLGPPRARPLRETPRSSTLERSRVFRFPDMPLFSPNDGPLYQLEEDAWPLGRKRCVPDDGLDRSGVGLPQGEGPSAPDARSLALPSNPARASRLSSGGSCAANPAPPEAFATRARQRPASRRERATSPRLDRPQPRPHGRQPNHRRGRGRDQSQTHRARARARTEASHRAPPGAPRGRSASGDPRDATTRSRGRHHPGGPPVAPDERPTAAITSFPGYRERRLVVTGERGRPAHRTTREERRAVRHRARDDAHEKASATGSSPRRAKRIRGDLGPDLVPTSETATGFLRAANYDFRSSGFRGGGGWKV